MHNIIKQAIVAFLVGYFGYFIVKEFQEGSKCKKCNTTPQVWANDDLCMPCWKVEDIKRQVLDNWNAGVIKFSDDLAASLKKQLGDS